ncbi:MAG: protein jag, partial [Blautia sp.]|nr:protein jag [Blautia sp.]
EKGSQAKETKAEKKAAKDDAKAEKAVARQTPESAPAENTPKVPADPEVVMSRAQEFLSAMLQAMGVEATVRTSYEDGTLNVNLEGEDMGILIGKRGQTLDSIQYLTSLVVNKGKAAYVRVKIDTENYRERRKATLENLAKNMAFKVKKTRRPAYLEPMNPYERRIIHSALQDDPYVTTHSEGEEPARKVVITLRRHERENAPGEVTDVIEETFEEETL